MRILAFLILAFFVSPAASDESTPLLFSRGAITIKRMAPPSVSELPWLPPAMQNPAVTFDIELRDAMTLYNQQGWFDLSGLSDNNGILMAFPAPGIAPIAPQSQYAPLDILLIEREGRITQIAPSIVLAELQEEIMPNSPILAFLFLKGGTCARLSIHPGDVVEHEIFKKSPVILTAPTPRPLTAPLDSPIK